MTESYRKKTGQLFIRVDSDLAENYKKLLKSEDKTLTEDLENYIKSRLNVGVENKTVDIRSFDELAKKVMAMEEKLGKLRAS